jgi:hypothetical protein
VKPVTKVSRVTYRKTKNVDLHCLRQDLAVSDLCKREHGEQVISSYEDLDKLVCSYNTVLSTITNAPLKTKVVRSRPQVPWYNQDIAEAKRKRRRAERVWRRSKSAEDLLVFKRLKNHVTYISSKARKEFYVKFIQEQEADQRKFLGQPKLCSCRKVIYVFLTIIITLLLQIISETIFIVRLLIFAKSLMFLILLTKSGLW